jgi:hypothetical protein
MVENNYIEKRKEKFSFITKNVEIFLANNQTKYQNDLFIESYKEQEDSRINIKKDAILILKKKERENLFIESEVFEKSIEIITSFSELGSVPEVIAFVAFFQANRILNKRYHRNKQLFKLSNKDRTLAKYWNEKFEQRNFDDLYDMNLVKTLLYSIKKIGSYNLTDEFRKLVLSLIDSPIKRRFSLNASLTVGLSILLAADLSEIRLDYRDVSKILELDMGELIFNFFKLINMSNQFDIKKFYKNNPSFVDLISSNLIRVGDHLTFNLDNPLSNDAEILGYTHLKYKGAKVTRKEWAFKVKNIENCSFGSNNYIFHRETGLSLKSLIELITI